MNSIPSQILKTLRFIALPLAILISGSVQADVFNMNAGTSIGWTDTSFTKTSGSGAQTIPGIGDTILIEGTGTTSATLNGSSNRQILNLEYATGVNRTITFRPSTSSKTFTINNNVTMSGNRAVSSDFSVAG